MSAIKSLYGDLGLADKFKAYEADSYTTLEKQIEEQTVLPKPVFTSLLKKIYKRSK